MESAYGAPYSLSTSHRESFNNPKGRTPSVRSFLPHVRDKTETENMLLPLWARMKVLLDNAQGSI